MSAKQVMIADTRVSWMDVGEDVVDVGEDARSALMRESAALSQMVKCFSCPLPSVKAVTFRIDARSFSRCKCSTTGSPAPEMPSRCRWHFIIAAGFVVKTFFVDILKARGARKNAVRCGAVQEGGLVALFAAAGR